MLSSQRGRKEPSQPVTLADRTSPRARPSSRSSEPVQNLSAKASKDDTRSPAKAKSAPKPQKKAIQSEHIPGLQFVNLTKDPEVERKLKVNRKLVRTTAIVHARRTTKWKRKAIATEDMKAVAAPVIPSPKQLRNGSLDPFDIFPVKNIKPDDLHIFSYC